MQSQAWLEGTILYIDGREYGYDFTLGEALDKIEEFKDMLNSPTGVRVFTRPIPKFDPSSKRKQP